MILGLSQACTVVLHGVLLLDDWVEQLVDAGRSGADAHEHRVRRVSLRVMDGLHDGAPSLADLSQTEVVDE